MMCTNKVDLQLQGLTRSICMQDAYRDSLQSYLCPSSCGLGFHSGSLGSCTIQELEDDSDQLHA